MKKTTKITALLLCVLVATSVAMTACDGEGSETDTPTESVSETISATESETDPVPVDVQVTVNVKEEDGTPVSGAVMRILWNEDYDDEWEPVLVTTDATGAATVTLPEGDYTVTFDTLPDMFVGGSTRLMVAEGMEAVTIEVINNTPDGTENHPFFLGEYSTSVELPAGASHHFKMFNGDRRTLVVKGSTSMKLELSGETYLPDENGCISIRITGNPEDHVQFSLSNTTEAILPLTILLESDPGALENPLVIAEGQTEVTASVPQGMTMYYAWTATMDGTLEVTSENTANDISLHNKTSGQSTSSTDGGQKASVAVKAGDVVFIHVAAKLATETNTEIVFALAVV